MLVLSRRIDEKIIINGGEVTIQVVSIDRGCVRLGITAPPEVSVNREEVEMDKQKNGPPAPRQSRLARRSSGR